MVEAAFIVPRTRLLDHYYLRGQRYACLDAQKHEPTHA